MGCHTKPTIVHIVHVLQKLHFFHFFQYNLHDLPQKQIHAFKAKKITPLNNSFVTIYIFHLHILGRPTFWTT